MSENPQHIRYVALRNSVREQQAEKIERLKKELEFVPTKPGCYLWKNAQGEVIYVGKAKQLRARMRQYIGFLDDRPKIPLLVSQIESFEYLVVNNEHESLVLERNLIAQYAPFFNADFKDDKTYPFIALTMDDMFPAIKYTREKHVKTTRYFGPFTDSRAARRLIEIARKVVPLCSARCPEWRRMQRALKARGTDASAPALFACAKNGHTTCADAAASADAASPASATTSAPTPATTPVPSSDVPVPARHAFSKPCFDCHVGLGPGACCGRVSPGEYAKNVEKVTRFLNGQHKEFQDELTHAMQTAAADLDFEKAARIKSRLDVLSSLHSKQNVQVGRLLDIDVIGMYREDELAGAHVLMVREGQVLNANEFVLNKGSNVPTQDLLHMFLLRYYEQTSSIPKEICVDELPEDQELMESWLTEKLASKKGARVRFSVPQKGEKAAFLKLANQQAKHTLLRYKVKNNYDTNRTNTALLQLENALAMERPPMRIECFDISTFHGAYTVASMVVFVNGKADTSQYRRFKIKAHLEEANDFLSMQEVMQRRYCAARMNDKDFGAKPDLIILDGGLPQLNAVIAMFDEMGVHDIALAGLAKRDEELFVPWQGSQPVVLPMGSPSLYLVKAVRDEAHRFAITFHRELRQKGMTTSILDEVSGIGPKRKKALLRYFGSFKNLRAATLEQLIDAHIVPDDVAREVHEVLQLYAARASSIQA